MSENPATPETPAVDGEQPQAGTPEAQAPAASDTQNVEITPAVQKLIDDAAKAASKAANREAVAAKAKLKELEAAEATRKDSELSEIERAQKAATEASQRADAAEARAQAKALEAEVTREAVAVGLNADLALKLIEGVEFDEDGSPQGVAEAIKALADAHPELVAKPYTPGTNPTNPGRGNAEPQISEAERLAAINRPHSADPYAGGGVKTDLY